MAGMAISLTAVQQWLGDSVLKERVTEEVLSGQKKMCLAITEAFAGSDVAGLKTTAEKTLDGKYYIVNGTKSVGINTNMLNRTLIVWPGSGLPMACSPTIS